MRTTIPVRNALLAANASYLDGVSGQATLEFYTGSRPISVGSTPGGTLIGTVTLSRPGWQTPAGAVMDANSIVGDSSADNTGTIGCAVLRDSSGVICHDYTVTAVGGGGDIELDTVGVVSGDPINITSLRHQQQEGT